MFKIVGPNISPLPFYESLAEQNHRKAYAFGCIYPLVTYRNMLMPFQVCLTDVADGTTPRDAINQVLLHRLSDGSILDITQSMYENKIELKYYEGFQVLRYAGLFPVNDLKYEGQYYLEIVLDTVDADVKSIYSEIFTSNNSIHNYISLEYSNDYNFELRNSIIDFSDNFIFKCYICAQVGKPEYLFEEETTERMGYSLIESQVSKKVYNFTFLAPEYLCDALRIMRLCKNKTIISAVKTQRLSPWFGVLHFNLEKIGSYINKSCS